jgi:general secretion pathway protein F
MPSYAYKALTKNGKAANGTCDAESLKQARQLLREQHLTLLNITETRGDSLKKKGGPSWWQFGGQRVSIADQSLFTRQLAILLGAGVSLEEALRSTAEQSEKQSVKNIVLGLRAKILEGFSLSRALSEYPRVFSRLYCSTVGAGEKTGRLEGVLERLADFIERRQQIRQKILQAAIYPSIVTIASILIVGFLLSYVVPKMVDVFVQSGQALPSPTQVLLAVSGALQHYGIYMLIGIIAGVILFRIALRDEDIRRRWHGFLLRVPLIGLTIKLTNTARFAHTFSMLNEAGVEVLEAMRVGAETVSNIPIGESLVEATRQVREGITIHRALQKTGYFPPLSIQLIASGENSGQLGPMLARSAFTQENSVQARISLLLTLFEPMVILVMGSVVLFIVLAILLPIFDLNQLVG